jgi:uncharacterized pyridoxamine 5'-phosphate oxidase family protein
MLTWDEFSRLQPMMAEFGAARFKLGVVYLATIRADGYPRVHPISAFVGEGHLYAFMEPTSPKAKDLQRSPHYAMHSLVTDGDGTNGEFHISGDAVFHTDPAVRARAVAACPYNPQDRYILFEFKLDRALTNEYAGGRPNVARWRLESQPDATKH